MRAQNPSWPGAKRQRRSRDRTHTEAGGAQSDLELAPGVEAEYVRLVVAPPGLAGPPEGGDRAGQTPLRGVLVGLDQHRPVLTLAPVALRARAAQAARRRDVEEEDAARLERAMNALEQAVEPGAGDLLVEEVGEALSDRGHRHAGGDLGVEKGADAEVGLRRALAARSRSSPPRGRTR